MIRLQGSSKKKMFSDYLDLKLFCERDNDLKGKKGGHKERKDRI